MNPISVKKPTITQKPHIAYFSLRRVMIRRTRSSGTSIRYLKIIRIDKSPQASKPKTGLGGMFSLDLISKCVKRHMNTNFKTNLVAMLALATTALGSDTCLGMQSYASADRAIGTGIVQPAPDDGGYHQRRDLPPIVSPSQVSPSQSSAELPPIVSAPSVPSATNLSSAKFQRKKMVLLSPIESSKPTTEAPSIAPTMAPPAIIQASNAFDDTGDNSRVAQAAQWGPNGLSLIHI